MTERLTNIERANLDAEKFIANTFPGRELFVADDGGFHLRSAGSCTDWWPPLSAPEVRHAIRVYLGLHGRPALSRDVANVLRGMRRVLPPRADANSYQVTRNLAGIESDEARHYSNENAAGH